MVDNLSENYRVNIFFTSGKSLGFVNVDLTSTVCNQLSTDIRAVIDGYKSRTCHEVMKITEGKATYYINIYEIACIEILSRKKEQ